MSKITNPEIRIKSARLLDGVLARLFQLEKEKKLLSKKNTFDSLDTVQEKIEEFKEIWLKSENVLPFIQEILELDFYQDIIDVYVVGYPRIAISVPMILSSNRNTENFVDTLTHELLHRLISDNKQKINAKDILLELFPKETLLCRNHIVLHSVLKKVYIEFLKDPKRLDANKERDKKARDYAKAWEIVEALGEDHIIARFKNLYKN